MVLRARYINGFDHPDVIAGAGTLAIEDVRVRSRTCVCASVCGFTVPTVPTVPAMPTVPAVPAVRAL